MSLEQLLARSLELYRLGVSEFRAEGAEFTYKRAKSLSDASDAILAELRRRDEERATEREAVGRLVEAARRVGEALASEFNEGGELESIKGYQAEVDELRAALAEFNP